MRAPAHILARLQELKVQFENKMVNDWNDTRQSYKWRTMPIEQREHIAFMAGVENAHKAACSSWHMLTAASQYSISAMARTMVRNLHPLGYY